jgi:dCTP diphosphatase
MKDTKNKVIKFTHDRDWDQFHSPENLAKSISIEAGELLECFQWNSEYKKEEVIDELADIVNYCILLSDKLNVDLEEIVLSKLKKNEEKYPIEKSKGKSDKYTKL